MTSNTHEVELTLMNRLDWHRRPMSLKAWTAHVMGAGMVVSAACVATVYLILPLAIRASVRVLTLIMDGCVWLAAAMSTGADPWTIASAVGRAAGEALATREASGLLLVLALVGALAFYWLQRLLGTDGRSSLKREPQTARGSRTSAS